MKLLYRTRDYAFIISAMGKLFVTLFALLLHPRQFCNGRCTRTPAFAEATAVKARSCPQ
jgi:hypothetical protein